MVLHLGLTLVLLLVGHESASVLALPSKTNADLRSTSTISSSDKRLVTLVPRSVYERQAIITPDTVAYFRSSTGWQSMTCIPNYTFTTSGLYAACFELGATSVFWTASCIGTSIALNKQGEGFACPSSRPSCFTVTLYSDLDESGTRQIMVQCYPRLGVSATMYRATTIGNGGTPLDAEPTGDAGSTGLPSGSTPNSQPSTSARIEENPGSSNEGLRSSDKIALGVGIGVGVPAMLIAFLAWWFPRSRRGNVGANPGPEVSTPELSTVGLGANQEGNIVPNVGTEGTRP